MSVEDKIKEVFKKSWEVFSNRFVVLILGTLVALLMMIFIVTIPPMVYGLYYLCAQVAQKKDAKVSDVFKGFSFFFRSWGMVLLLALGIIVGLILFIIPGILLMIVWQYAFAVMVLKGKGIKDSLGTSYRLGKKNFAFSVIFWILMMVISSIGSLTRIGWLVTVPFTTIATIFAVQVLDKKSGTKKSVKKKRKKK